MSWLPVNSYHDVTSALGFEPGVELINSERKSDVTLPGVICTQTKWRRPRVSNDKVGLNKRTRSGIVRIESLFKSSIET